MRSNGWLKPWQTPLNKAPSKGGKIKDKKGGPKSQPKGQTRKWVTKGQRNKSCSSGPTRGPGGLLLLVSRSLSMFMGGSFLWKSNQISVTLLHRTIKTVATSTQTTMWRPAPNEEGWSLATSFWEKGEFSPEIPLRQCHHLAIFHRKRRLHVGCEKYRILLWHLSSFNRVYGIINNFEILISTPQKYSWRFNIFLQKIYIYIYIYILFIFWKFRNFWQ
jgi:hypothetical protein